MSDWRVTGQAGWDENTGYAVYHVTKGSKSLNRHDHLELERLLVATLERDESAERVASALSALTVQLSINDQDGMTEMSGAFGEAREALSEWRALTK